MASLDTLSAIKTQVAGDALAQYQPSSAESTYTDLVMERFNLAHRNQYPYFSDFDRYYKLYESYVNESKSIWQTKMFIPMTFSVIERFLPRIMSTKPTVNFMPRRPDAVKSAQNMQSLFEWQWDQVSRVKDGGMYVELLKFVKDALITGTAVAKVYWRMESRDEKYLDDKNEVNQRSKKYFDSWDFEQIDPYDFFFDPEAVDIQRASWVIHRTRKTLDELRAINKEKGVEIYKNLDVLESLQRDTLASSENDFKYRRKIALGSSQILNYDSTTKKFEIMECWGMFPKLDKDGQPTKDLALEPKVITIAGRSVCIRSVDYPYWHGKKPFIKYTPFPRNYDFYGIPIIKHLERLQFYTNEFVSQKFDNQVINLNQMIVVDPAANLEDWQLVWRPGGVIRAHPEFVKPLALGDVTSGIDNSLEYLSEAVQLATGLSDYYTGGVNAEETANKTATGANMIEEQISSRVQEAVQILEEQVIKELGYQVRALDAQFIKLPMVVRVVGTDGKPDFPLIMPDDARFDYDVMPEAGSTQPTNQALQRNQFMQVLQIITSNEVMSQATDWVAILKELWMRFGIKNGDKLMISTPGSEADAITGEESDNPAQQQQAQGSVQPAGQPATTTGQMFAQAMNPSKQQANPGSAPQGAGAGSDAKAPKAPGTISTKFDDLTLREQEQWLAMLGIQADTASRTENFATKTQNEKHDRNLELLKVHQQTAPVDPLADFQAKLQAVKGGQN
jgi:hypothetical protein